jgi:hypothetical protein
MNKAGFLYLGAVMSLGSLLLATSGCGDDTSGAGGSAGAGSSSTAASSTGSKAGSTSSASTSGSGGGVMLNCTDYCAQVTKNCSGDVAQFGGPSAADSCKNTCASWAPGALADTTGNTLGCRIYHSGAPAAGAAAMHCGHAGLIGGDLDPAVAGGMQCGDGVDAFCKLAVATCKAADVVWADEAACKADAVKFKAATTAFSATKDTGGDTFSCRAYHLTVAASSPAAATMHCKHIAAVSETCKAP